MGKNHTPYTDSRLGNYENDSDRTVTDEGECMEDGCGFKQPIDTSFENTSEDFVEHPRSDEVYKDPIHDVKAHRYPHRHYSHNPAY